MVILMLLLVITYSLGGITAVKFMKIVVEMGKSEGVSADILAKAKRIDEADIKWTIFLIWPIVALTIPTRFEDSSAV